MNRRNLLPIAIGLLLLAGLALVQAFRAGQPSGEPWQPPARTETVNRCAEHRGFEILVDRGASREQMPTWEFLERYGATKVPAGRHAGQPAAGLADLMGAADRIEVVPCTGAPLSFTREDLEGDSPGILIVAAQRGFLKVLDYRESDRGMRMLRGVHAVRVGASGTQTVPSG